MDLLKILEWTSIAVGLLSEAFWVVAAIVKVLLPQKASRGLPDGQYMPGARVDGADLLPTLKAQTRWNSRAAFAAVLAVLLQIATKFA